MILCDTDYAKKLNSKIFPGIQGGPLCHVIAAKAVALKEAQTETFKIYAAQIIKNAQALACALIEKGYHLTSGGTDNHLMLVDLRTRDGMSGHEASEYLAQAGLIVNKNVIPFDTRPAIQTSGIRLGTPALTSRNMGQDEMRLVAGWIDDVLTSHGDEAVTARVLDGVGELCDAFPILNDYHH